MLQSAFYALCTLSFNGALGYKIPHLNNEQKIESLLHIHLTKTNIVSKQMNLLKKRVVQSFFITSNRIYLNVFFLNKLFMGY